MGARAGTTCVPTCNAGYEKDGDGMCQSDGSWQKFACRMPEIESGVVFARITTYETTDCSKNAKSVVEHKECRCRQGSGCQKITCKANGDYTITSYSSDVVECQGSPIGIPQEITSDAQTDSVKFGQCQLSLLGATPFSGVCGRGGGAGHVVLVVVVLCTHCSLQSLIITFIIFFLRPFSFFSLENLF